MRGGEIALESTLPVSSIVDILHSVAHKLSACIPVHSVAGLQRQPCGNTSKAATLPCPAPTTVNP